MGIMASSSFKPSYEFTEAEEKVLCDEAKASGNCDKILEYLRAKQEKKREKVFAEIRDHAGKIWDLRQSLFQFTNASCCRNWETCGGGSAGHCKICDRPEFQEAVVELTNKRAGS